MTVVASIARLDGPPLFDTRRTAFRAPLQRLERGVRVDPLDACDTGQTSLAVRPWPPFCGLRTGQDYFERLWQEATRIEATRA
jgi:hypothetical protein